MEDILAMRTRDLYFPVKKKILFLILVLGIHVSAVGPETTSMTTNNVTSGPETNATTMNSVTTAALLTPSLAVSPSEVVLEDGYPVTLYVSYSDVIPTSLYATVDDANGLHVTLNVTETLDVANQTGNVTIYSRDFIDYGDYNVSVHLDTDIENLTTLVLLHYEERITGLHVNRSMKHVVVNTNVTFYLYLGAGSNVLIQCYIEEDVLVLTKQLKEQRSTELVTKFMNATTTNFTCAASNRLGSVTTFVLIVAAAPPSLTVSPTEVVLEDGYPVTLYVSYSDATPTTSTALYATVDDANGLRVTLNETGTLDVANQTGNVTIYPRDFIKYGDYNVSVHLDTDIENLTTLVLLHYEERITGLHINRSVKHIVVNTNVTFYLYLGAGTNVLIQCYIEEDVLVLTKQLKEQRSTELVTKFMNATTTNFTCAASNRLGSVTTFVPVVAAPPPSLTVSPTEVVLEDGYPVTLYVSYSDVIPTSLYATVDDANGLRVTLNVTETLYVANQTGNVTIYSRDFIDFGDYNVSVHLDNDIENLTALVLLHYEERITGLHINRSMKHVVVNWNVTFYIYLGAGTNVFIQCYIEEDVLVFTKQLNQQRRTELVTKFMNVTTTNFTCKASNRLGSVTTFVPVVASPPPSLTVSPTEVVLEDGYPVTLYVRYSDARPTALYATVDDANGLRVTLNVTETLYVANQTGNVTIYSRDFIEYGDYNVSVHLDTDIENLTTLVLLHYEERITGLHINRSVKHIVVNTNVTFYLYLGAGTNVLIQCYIEEDVLVLTKQLKEQRSTELVTKFMNATTTNFTCAASNRLGSVTTFVPVVAAPPPSLTVSPTEVVLEDGYPVTLYVSYSDVIPTSLYATVDDANGLRVTLNVTETLYVANQTGNVTIYSRDFIDFGDYNVSVHLDNDIENLTALVLLHYEERITGLHINRSMKHVVVNWNVTFYIYLGAGTNVFIQCYIEEDVLVFTKQLNQQRRTELVTKFMNVTTTNFTCKASNRLGSVTTFVPVVASPPPSLTVSPTEVVLEDGYPVTLYVRYSDARPTALYATVDDANGLRVTLNVTETLYVANQTGNVTIYSRDFIEYGDYNVSVHLDTDIENLTTLVLLHYEERITGLHINRSVKHIVVNTNVTFYLYLGAGTNVLIQCYIEEDVLVLTKQLKEQRSTELVTKFMNATTTNFTCAASNRLGSVTTFVPVVAAPPPSLTVSPTEVVLEDGYPVTLYVSYSDVIPTSLYATVDDANGLRVTLNVTETLYVANQTGNVTIYSRDFIDFGDYNVSVHLDNDIENLTALVLLHYEERITGLHINRSMKHVVVNWNVTFYIYLGAGTNVFIQCYIEEDVLVFTKQLNQQRRTELVTKFMNVTTTNFTCKASNRLGSVTTFVPVVASPPPSLTVSPTEVVLEDGYPVTLYVRYSDARPTALYATVDDANGLRVTLNVTETLYVANQTGNVTIYSRDFIEYGDYNVSVHLDNDIENLTALVLLHYEERITGLYVNRSMKHVAVNTNVTFYLYLGAGTNVFIQCYIEEDVLVFTKQLNQQRRTELVTKFMNATATNCTCRASNRLGNVNTSVPIISLYPVQGFSIHRYPSLAQTSEVVTFNLTLARSTDLPMGSVQMNVSFGDSESQMVPLGDLNSFTSVNISYAYGQQGNYTAVFYIYSEISNLTIRQETFVWNPLNVSLTANLREAKVNEEIQFYLHPASFGFEYKIRYGDQNTTSNPDGALYTFFNTSTWKYRYADAGKYLVQLTAWNPFYTTHCNFSVLIQRPIPYVDISLSPQHDEIPIPDGNMTFILKLESDLPSPTEVFCHFDFEEDEGMNKSEVFVKEKSQPTNIKFGEPIVKLFQYLTPGLKQIRVVCFNIVSNLTKTATVYVRDFKLQNFTIVVPDEVMMNMTMIPPTDEKGTAVLSYDPVDVGFSVSLFNCSRLPPDIDIAWDFGTGNNKSWSRLVSGYVYHRYTERTTHTLRVYLRSADDNHTSDFQVKIGVVDFASNTFQGYLEISNELTFTASGPSENSTYSINFDVYDNVRTVTRFAYMEETFNYTKMGEYYPHLIVQNDNFYERLYLTKKIKIDYTIELISFTFSNESLLLPPGEVVVNVSIRETNPMITCFFQMGDKHNTEEIVIQQNISVNDPLSFHFEYLAFGNHDVRINCMNLLDNVTKSTKVSVTNKCFSYGGDIAGIFAWQYFESSNPLIVSTADELDLSSRMSVECFQKNPKFDWKINGEIVSSKDNKGTFRFNRASVDPGDHKITLNVTLNDTWCVEHMYIRFIRPSPFAWIKGGTMRNVTNGNVSIDAISMSYSTEHGYGHTEGLSFTFRCYRSAYSNFGNIREEYSDIIKNSSFPELPSKKCKEDFKVTSKGVATLDVGASSGFLIVVNVSQTNTTPSFFFQMISVSAEDRPTVEINCKLNCRHKLAIQSPLKVKAECQADCGNKETLIYEWTLFKIGSNETQEKVDLEQNKTKTGTNKQILVVNAGVFDEGMTYMLEVTVTSETRISPEKANIYFNTNWLPNGGNCTVKPSSGIGMTTTFKVHCDGWKDEGQTVGKGIAEDAKEPLKYEYIQETQRVINGNTVITKSALFFGGENSATQLRLQIGDEAFDNNVTVLVRIKDMYGDVTENRDAHVQVYRNQSYVPSDGDDTDSLQDLFETFNAIFYPLQGGGNKMALVQFVGSMTAMLTSINVTSNGNSKLDHEMSKKNYELMQTLRGTVSLESSEALNAVDTNNVMQKAKACLGNLNIVNDSSLDIGVEIALNLVNNLENLTLMRPFPVEDWQSILDGISGAFDVVDIAIGALVPDPVTYDSVAREYNLTHSVNANLTAEEEVELQKRIQKAYMDKLNEQEQINTRLQSGQGNISAYNMMAALGKSLDIIGNTILFGEAESVIERTNINMTLEKTTLQNLVNGTNNKTAFRMDFSNVTDYMNETAEIQIQTAVFNKIPQYHGEGANTLTSKGIMVKLKHTDGSRANISMDLHISNRGVAFSQRYQPLYLKDDPDQMFYFNFEVLSENDAVIFYIRPEDFNPFDYTSYGLYDVFVRYNAVPSISLFDWTHSMTIRDWVNADYGFKIFVPENVLNTGNCYMALKPLNAPPTPQISNRLRRRRSVDVNQTQTTTSNTTIFEPADVNFIMVIVTTGCRTWDEDGQIWSSTGCTILPFSTLNETFCRCPGTTSNMFATTFANSINFQSVWSKFDINNASVYGTLIALVVVYILGCIWARRKDRKDNEMWKTQFLCDSDSSDQHFYLMTVHTAMRRGAGTESKVNFVVGSDECDSGVRILSNGDKQGFPSGSVRSFIMGTSESFGNLQYLRIWHDNSGKGNNASWNLHKVTIDDLHVNKRYVFLCENWLSVDHEDGQTVRTIPVCNDEKLIEFNTLFPEYMRHGITEDHLWFSAFMRPERSSFSRLQRVSCILMLLLLTMITNAMFFKSDSEEASKTAYVSVGMMRFSLSTVYVSVFGILITTAPVILVTLLFTYSKAKQPKSRKTKHKYLEDVQKTPFNDHAFYSMDHLPLPTFVRYIAWSIIALAVSASAFFLLLFSMEWGNNKSTEWLTSFFFSTTTSIVFVDPIKVLLFAMVPIIICRKPFHNKAPKMNLQNVRDGVMTMNGSNIRDLIYFRSSILLENTSIDYDAIRKIRFQHEKERKALQSFFEVMFYIIFSYVVFSISYIDRDMRSYQFKQHILNTMNPLKTGFHQIRDAQGFVKWLNGTFYLHYFPTSHYNGENMGELDRFYIDDLVNTKIGPPRLRLVRMPRGKCRKLVENRDCIPSYDMYEEDERSYCVGWNDNTSTTCNSPHLFSKDAWRYERSEDIWGIPITGEYATYGGGGYVLKLENGLASSKYILEELIRYQWINRETRAVFLEFTLYNANTNLFVYLVFLTEFTENGGFLTWIDVYPFRPYQHTGALGVYALICYIIYLVVLLFSTVKLFLKLRSHGCQCLRVSWNLVDVLCALISFAAVSVWVLRFVYTKQAMSLYYDDKKAFVNFQHVVIWDMMFNIIASVLVFISNIRLLRLLGYNKKMSELANVISNAASDLVGFAIIFGIAFLAWAMFGFLVFGSQMNDYRSVFTAMGTLCNSLIGKNKLDIMVQASPTLAKLFYFSYVLFVMMILMTMFAVILNQSITDVRCDTAKCPDTYGIIELMTKSVYALLGITQKKRSGRISSTNPFNNYLPEGSSTNPHLDTTNIVRTMRDIFGNIWSNEATSDGSPSQEKEDPDMEINSSAMLEEHPKDNAMLREFMPELYSIPIATTAELTNVEGLDKRIYQSYA